MLRFPNELKMKPSVLAYYLFLFLLVLSDSIGNTVIPGYANSVFQQLLLLLQLGFAMLCLFFQCNSKPSLTLFVCLFGIGAVAYIYGQRTGLLLTFLAAVLGRSADPDKILKLLFAERLLLFLLIVGASLVGILDGREALFAMTNADEKGVTLGYTHANTFSATVVTLLLLYTAINRRQFSWPQGCLVLGVELVNYLITRARIGLIVIVLLLCAILLCKNRHLCKFLMKLAAITLLLVLLFNFTYVHLRLHADSQLLSNIDMKVFNGRMGWSAMYIDTYGLTIFGSLLEESKIAAISSYHALDNGYTVVLLFYGIVGLAAFLVLYEKTVLELIKKQQHMLVLIAMCFALWMMYEGITVSATCNFIFLLHGKSFLPDNSPARRYLW